MEENEKSIDDVMKDLFKKEEVFGKPNTLKGLEDGDYSKLSLKSLNMSEVTKARWEYDRENMLKAHKKTAVAGGKAHKGIKKSEKAIDNMRASWEDEERKKNQSETMQDVWKDEERKQKSQDLWKDTDFKLTHSVNTSKGKTGKKQNTYKCPVCNRIGGLASMKQWGHGDKCTKSPKL